MREETRVGELTGCARRQGLHSLPRIGPVFTAPALNFIGQSEPLIPGNRAGVESHFVLSCG